LRVSKPFAAFLLLAILLAAVTFAGFLATRSRPVDSQESQAVAAKPGGVSHGERTQPAVNPPRPETAPSPRPIVTYFYPVTVGAKWVYQTRVFDTPDEERTLVVTKVKDLEDQKIVTVERVERDSKRTPWEKVRVGDQELYRMEDEGL
jgi:hypothetical protein